MNDFDVDETNAARFIKDFCEAHTECIDCIFSLGFCQCRIGKPTKWNLNEGDHYECKSKTR